MEQHFFLPDPNAHENQAFPLMPVHPNYALPPFLTCDPRKRKEITAVVQMITESVTKNMVAGSSEAYPFIHWVTYTRIGCGCGQDHHVTYELDIVPAAPQAPVPGMTMNLVEIKRTPTHLNFLLGFCYATVTAITIASPPKS